MCAKTDQPESHGRAFDRLVLEALAHDASSPAGHDDCPDVELIAAYADRGALAGVGDGPRDDEREQLEVHFASCERCQEVLAALGAALEAPADTLSAPIAADEAVRAPAPAWGAPATAAARPPSPTSPQRWLWWLTPACGAAAAALLWMVLRPATPAPVQTAGDYTSAAQSQRPLQATDSGSPIVSVPVDAGRAANAPRREPQALDRLSKAESVAKDTRADERDQAIAPFAAQSKVAAPAEAQAAPPGAGQEATTARAEIAAVGIAPQAAVAQGMIAPAPRAPQAPAPATPPLAGNRAEAATQQGAVRALTLSAPALIANAAPSAQSAAPPQDDPAAPVQINLYTFTPPDGSATWRLGTSGHIERSLDQGRTWQLQSSGVTNDLIAGSAATKDAAWVVGRGGVILRTTDGVHWERIAPPNGVTGPWAAVAAHNAMTATVIADDLRRYATEDGGQTWKQQP